MTLSEILNEYMAALDCSQNELAKAADMTPAALSYYRNEQRTPKKSAISKLTEGIVSIAESKEIGGISYDDVYRRIFEASGYIDIEPECFGENFSRLVGELRISLNRLARAMDIDASLLSRIKLGERLPSDTDKFTAELSMYLCSQLSESDESSVLCSVLGIAPHSSIPEQSEVEAAVRRYLLCTVPSGQTFSKLDSYLHSLDDFDLGEYITVIRFDKLKIPSAPIRLPSTKHYYGLEEMKQGELDFLKATATSTSKLPFFMNSDMPMADMAKDTEFGRKWMFGIAACIKKGLHLNMVHNIDRRLDEMLLGLEAWIPIYMTGQITPYYIPKLETKVYHHLNYVSGAAALTGECIDGHHKDGRYCLTNLKSETAYYRRKAEYILSKAEPLMDIYDVTKKEAFFAFVSSESKAHSERHTMYTSLPLYTISDKLFLDILRRNGVPKSSLKQFLEYLHFEKREFLGTIQSCKVTDIIPRLTAEDIAEAPPVLSLSGGFFEEEIFYTAEEYSEHLRQTERLAERYTNYTVTSQKRRIFKNIRIALSRGSWVMISKSRSPAIHFVIRHPKMINAVEKTLFRTDQ
ncbi:MAG: helix-turn-helix transcriptional regulator [Ruminococcus sp.]|nr:helix-turn-helix transcriptional regulator [Ruminococcus sp.]